METITVAICMDRRANKPVSEDIKKEYGNVEVDYQSLAGIIDMIAGRNKKVLKSLKISVMHHGSRDIILYIHEDCGYYSIKNPIREKKVQTKKAKKARKVLTSLKELKKAGVRIRIRWVPIRDPKAVIEEII